MKTALLLVCMIAALAIADAGLLDFGLHGLARAEKTLRTGTVQGIQDIGKLLKGNKQADEESVRTDDASETYDVSETETKDEGFDESTSDSESSTGNVDEEPSSSDDTSSATGNEDEGSDNTASESEEIDNTE